MICCENIVKILWMYYFFLIPPQISATIIYLFFSSHFQQWHCHKIFSSYFGNGIAIIGFFFQHIPFRAHSSHTRASGISIITLPKFLLPEPLARAQKRNQLWQCHCRNRGRKKNCSNCGNAIAENGRENKIVVAEIWEGIKKKKVLRSQYFYNIFTTNYR